MVALLRQTILSVPQRKKDNQLLADLDRAILEPQTKWKTKMMMVATQMIKTKFNPNKKVNTAVRRVKEPTTSIRLRDPYRQDKAVHVLAPKISIITRISATSHFQSMKG